MRQQREFLCRAASVSADYVCVLLPCHSFNHTVASDRCRSHHEMSGRAQHAHRHYHFDRAVTCSYSNESIRAKTCFQVIGGTFASLVPNFFNKASRTVKRCSDNDKVHPLVTALGGLLRSCDVCHLL
jgi:hypothetical protein